MRRVLSCKPKNKSPEPVKLLVEMLANTFEIDS